MARRTRTTLRVSTMVGALALAVGLLVLMMGSGPVSGQTVPEQKDSTQRYSITDLGALRDRNYSYANDINERGQVVGASLTPSDWFHALLWEDGKMRDLGTLRGGRWSEAHGINDRGQVVGRSDTAFAGSHAALWSKRGVHRERGFTTGG